MNAADSLLHSLRPTEQALVGGKAPTYWQSELGRICELDFLWQNCVWMDALVSIHLSLKDEPLLGYALQLLTLDTDVTEVETVRSHSSPSPFAPHYPKLHSAVQDAKSNRFPMSSASVSHEVAVIHSSSPQPQTEGTGVRGVSTIERNLVSLGHPVEAVLQQPLRVSQQLLSSLVTATRNQTAYKSPPSTATHSQTKLHPQVLSEDTNSPNFPYTSPPSSATNSQNATKQTLSQQRVELTSQVKLPSGGNAVSVDIRENLTYRTSLNRITSRTLKHFHPNAFTKVAGVGTQGNISEERVKLPVSIVSLAQQWSVPLNGQTASIQLLAHLAHPTIVNSNSSRSATKQTAISRRIDLPNSAKVEKNQQSQRFLPSLTESTTARSLPTGVNQTTNHNTDINVILPTQIAPPVVTSPLPPLVPPQIVNLPPPNVGSAIIRQEAKQEETATSEADLTILAANIKRILDEEARRYGIDV